MVVAVLEIFVTFIVNDLVLMSERCPSGNDKILVNHFKYSGIYRPPLS